MTTTNDRLLVIGEYESWREEQEFAGKPSGLDAYKEHLIAREPIEKLEKITALFDQLDPNPTSDGVRSFGWDVIRLLDIERKELSA